MILNGGLEEPLTKFPESCPTWKMVILSLPRFSTQMAWSAHWAAFGPYLSTLLPDYVSVLTQYLGPIIGMLVTPIVCVLSDRCMHPVGRRRPFIALGTLFTLMSWALMLATEDIAYFLGGESKKKDVMGIIMIIAFSMMITSVNMVQAPSALMVADFVGHEQTKGGAINQACAVLGAMTVSLFIKFIGPAHQHLEAFLLMLSGIMIICSTAVCALRETPLSHIHNNRTVGQDMLYSLTAIFKGTSCFPKRIVVYTIIVMFIQGGYVTYNANKAQFFGVEVFGGDPQDASTCKNNCTEAQIAYNKGVQFAGGDGDFLYYSLGLVYSFFIPTIVRQIGIQRTVRYSILPQAALIFLALYQTKSWFDLTSPMLSAITQNTVLCLMVPITVHVARDEYEVEYEGYTPDIGVFTGVLNSAICVGQLIALIGTSIFVAVSTYQMAILFGGCLSLIAFAISCRLVLA